jgi:hypothetical protein
MTLDGTVRQVNVNEGTIVVQTPQRRIVTVTAYRSTPVWYQGRQQGIADLQPGDRIRVEIDPLDATATETVARRIDVTQPVGDSATASNGATVTTIEGAVLRVDPTLDYAWLNDGRGEVRVDMSKAEDPRGEVIHARDVRTGEKLAISGSFNRTGDLFLASTVRFGVTPRSGSVEPGEDLRYGVVTITGTVVETLEDAPTIAVRDRDSSRVDRIWVVDEFVVRTRGTAVTTAGLLRADDVVVVQAFRDSRGNLVAQTIRLRNR